MVLQLYIETTDNSLFPDQLNWNHSKMFFVEMCIFRMAWMTLRLKVVAFVPNALYDNTLHIQEYVHSLEHMWSMWYKAAIFSILSEMYEKFKRLLEKNIQIGKSGLCTFTVYWLDTVKS